jgi:hypothetical protein
VTTLTPQGGGINFGLKQENSAEHPWDRVTECDQEIVELIDRFAVWFSSFVCQGVARVFTAAGQSLNEATMFGIAACASSANCAIRLRNVCSLMKLNESLIAFSNSVRSSSARSGRPERSSSLTLSRAAVRAARRAFWDKVGMPPDRPPSWHRLGPRDMPLVAKRSRLVAVAVPIVAIGGVVAMGSCQQCAQPQQPYFTYHQTLIGRRCC